MAAVSKCGALKIQLSLPCQKGPPPPSLSLSILSSLHKGSRSSQAASSFAPLFPRSPNAHPLFLRPLGRPLPSVGRSGTFLCPPPFLPPSRPSPFKNTSLHLSLSLFPIPLPSLPPTRNLPASDSKPGQRVGARPTEPGRTEGRTRTWMSGRGRRERRRRDSTWGAMPPPLPPPRLLRPINTMSSSSSFSGLRRAGGGRRLRKEVSLLLLMRGTYRVIQKHIVISSDSPSQMLSESHT